MTAIGRAPGEKWLDEHADGVDPADALAFFDSLPVIDVFRRVSDDVRLGAAVRAARLALLARGNPLGLAYVPYGPTELQMGPVDGRGAVTVATDPDMVPAP